MKITLDQATLAQAVISHLKNVGVASDILQVDFRYTRVPYTVFAEVELSESKPSTSRKSYNDSEDAKPVCEPIVDPATVTPAEEPAAEEPKPESPAAPLFSGG